MPQRVVVFIDYQNIYKGARHALFDHDPRSHVEGQIHPRRLGLKLKGVGSTSRELAGVRVYRGQPSSRHDPTGFAACDRQVALWTQQSLVTPVTRPLNYRDPHTPREKGIDVRIAVDFVMMAMNDQYDVGILCSADTDLIPAIEAVVELKGPTACEVVAWRPDTGSPIALRIPDVKVHLLGRTDYEHVHDDMDYTRRRRRR